MITGRVDSHSHFIFPAYRKALESVGMDKIGGIPVPPWSPELAIAFMDTHGIERQVLSVSDPGVGFLSGDKATELARSCNEYVAEVVAEGPDRFSGLAVIPGESVTDAIAESDHAIKQLQLSGIGLLSSYDGKYLGDPSFEPLLEKLNGLAAWVFVHPTAVPQDNKPDLPIPDFMAEYPFDTTRTFLSLLLHNSFERFPRIRWQFAHGGGTLPMLAARINAASAHAKVVAPLLGLPERASEHEPESAREAMASCYFDTALIAVDSSLQALNGIAPPERILFGSDWPFAGLMYPPEGDPQPAIANVYSEEDQRAINAENGERLLAPPD